MMPCRSVPGEECVVQEASALVCQGAGAGGDLVHAAIVQCSGGYNGCNILAACTCALLTRALETHDCVSYLTTLPPGTLHNR